jgi:hypothetical protein
MRTLRNPLGILLGHTIPAVVLFVLFANMLWVIAPLLEPASIMGWRIMGALLLGVTLGSTLYAWSLWRTGRSVHFIYGLSMFAVYVPLLWYFMSEFSTLMPWDVPRWMVPPDAELYAFRLLSIPLLHALFVLVSASLREGDRGTPLRDLLIAGAIPLGIYLFVQVVEPFRGGGDFERHVWVVIGIALIIAFLFFTFRAFAALAVVRPGPYSAARGLFVRVLVALVLPMLGLLVHNGGFGGFRDATDIMGDLHHWGFYAAALFNALVVIWPSSTAPAIRLLQFVLRSIGFSYVLYFFLLFVPWVPLSVVAIIAFGLGFLLLAPVLLLIVQGGQLLDDLRFLSAHRSRWSLGLAFLLGLSVMPAIITAHDLYHRQVLNEALHYVYHQDPLEMPKQRIDEAALANVLDAIDANKERNQRVTPFLTPYYNWIVLDNLTLGPRKMADLRIIFHNDYNNGVAVEPWPPSSASVTVDTATTRSTYDPDQQAWRTWIDLRMSNSAAEQSEFVTTFDLPDGAWVCDNYLMIEGERVPGILAEKKAAEWIYRQIVNVRRDPSLLRYITPHRLQYRVFPFAANETRESGIEILHKEPFAISIGGQDLLLGDTSAAVPSAAITSTDGAITYIPASLKQQLPRVQRDLDVHIILDARESSRGERERLIADVDAFVAEHALQAKDLTVHLCDAYDVRTTWDEAGKDRYREHIGHGGFFTDRVMRRILVEHCTDPSAKAPVMVLVTGSPTFAKESYGVLFDDLHHVADRRPEGGSFIVLGSEGNGSRRSFEPEYPVLNSEWLTLERPVVLAWPDARAPKSYLRADSSASIVIDHEKLGPLGELGQRDWSDQLALQAHWRTHELRGDAGPTGWQALVRGSFQTQAMITPTAWICLENEAQRRALQAKQDASLNAKEHADLDEDVISMSEPGMWWMILPLLVVLLWRRRASS